MGRRVTAATIIGADFLRHQQVGEGRLADTRRADEGDRPVAVEKPLQISNEGETPRAHCVNWHSESYAGNPIVDRDSIMHEICFVDDDHGSCATASHQCEIAFQARQVEIGIPIVRLLSGDGLYPIVEEFSGLTSLIVADYLPSRLALLIGLVATLLWARWEIIAVLLVLPGAILTMLASTWMSEWASRSRHERFLAAEARGRAEMEALKSRVPVSLSKVCCRLPIWLCRRHSAQRRHIRVTHG
jgi:hypothetical protein